MAFISSVFVECKVFYSFFMAIFMSSRTCLKEVEGVGKLIIMEMFLELIKMEC